jgi:hypothetical protein
MCASGWGDGPRGRGPGAGRSSLSSGDVGLVAGTFDKPGVTIDFDNFVVTAP